MLSNEISVGDLVFIFSESLKEVIIGSVEGFNENRTRVKVLQETSEGLIRHLVSWVYVFSTKEDAESAFREYIETNGSQIDYQSGMTVYLKKSGSLIKDAEGYPYVYQIIKVYHDKRRVSLVNSYGESIGTFSLKDIEYCSHEPIFRRTDYHEGQSVVWLEGDDVYTGIITHLREHTAEVSDIKKLYPLDYKKNLPYYKIQSDDLYNNNVLASIVGDDIDSD